MSIIPSLIAIQAATQLNLSNARRHNEQFEKADNYGQYYYDIHGERHYYEDDADRQTHRRADRRD